MGLGVFRATEVVNQPYQATEEQAGVGHQHRKGGHWLHLPWYVFSICKVASVQFVDDAVFIYSTADQQDEHRPRATKERLPRPRKVDEGRNRGDDDGEAEGRYEIEQRLQSLE